MSLRGKSTHAVSESGDTPRLIEGQPVLDPVTESLETESGVSHEILGAFLLVQPTSVVVVQSLGQIPTVMSGPVQIHR